MYERFYGLSELPFELTANPKYLFLAARPEFVFVGPHLPLRGPSGIVEPLVGHDNHMHVRIYPPH